MRLRTRLFLSISALITVALVGLLLGLVSVTQIAGSRERLINQSFTTLDLGQRMRQHLGDQMVNLLGEEVDVAALQDAQQKFMEALQEGLDSTADPQAHEQFEKIAASYQVFLDVVRQPADLRTSLLDQRETDRALEALRGDLAELQRHALAIVRTAETATRDRAQLIAGLLGLVSVAVLLIGFITAQGIAHKGQ